MMVGVVPKGVYWDQQFKLKGAGYLGCSYTFDKYLFFCLLCVCVCVQRDLDPDNG